MNPRLLKLALKNPDLANLTDAAINARQGFSVPVLTPKEDRVTYTTLAAVWDTITAATFHDKLMAAGLEQTTLGSVARYIDKLLQGSGIDPGAAEVPQYGLQFVQAGLATADQFNAVFFTSSYVANGPTTLDDITNARAMLAFESEKQALIASASTIWNTWIDQAESAQNVSQFPTAMTLPGGNG